MLSNLLAIDDAFKTFFTQFTDTVGYAGFLGIFLGIEALFIMLFVIKSMFSYEARLKRALDKANTWLFKYKKVDVNNIKAFNEVIKSGPKRFVYYWQQYILYRDGGPSAYMSEDNIIEKPLRTSSWKNNVKNLGILTAVWAALGFVFGLASQYTPQQQYLSFQATAVALVIPALVAVLGVVAIIFIKGKRVLNLDDIYHLYHLFARFVNNACADLPEFIDFDLLFTAKEIEKGNAQLREYYEARARKAKEEFENAKKNDRKIIEYNFEDVGVDGRLLLNRAMKESETYINKKTTTESKMAQVEAQKDALRRNYENVQMDLQRKIQASKENIQKLIEQQAATTSRVEVGLLRQQQEKEVNKQEALQKDYDAEEARYKLQKEERDQEIEVLREELDESLKAVEKGMVAEYKTFYDEVMKSAYNVARKQIDDEKKVLEQERDKNETELINVQTQIKRLHDENATLRARIEELTNQKLAAGEEVPETQVESEGHYDEAGNYIYADGSYHDTKGLFHDVDGKIYDMNGVLVGEDEEEISEEAKQAILEKEQIDKFGAYVPVNEENEVTEEVKPEITEQAEEPVKENAEVEVRETPVEEVEAVEEPKTEEPVEEAKPEEVVEEEVEESVTPAKKRGRPRKTTTANETTEKKPVAKRGRPRKTTAAKVEEQKPAASTVKRGRPRKTTATPIEAKPQTTNAKRGRPKKTTSSASKPKTAPAAQPTAKRGRPRKADSEQRQDLDALSRINQLISEEEAKLSRMKALLNSEIDQVMVQDKQAEVEKEKDSIMEAVETLKEQANDVQTNDKSNEELSSINKRLEDLIKEISVLNNKK